MTAPANDDLSDRIELSGASGSVGPVTIDDATSEGSELGSAKNQSIWYVIHAADDATGVHLSTEGSLAGDSGSGDGFPSGFGSLDTRLAVWEATIPFPGYGALIGHSIAFNEDHSDDEWWSDVTFDMTAGNYYFIQIGTFDTGYTGTVVLSWTGVPVSAPPHFIDFSGAFRGVGPAFEGQVSAFEGEAVPVVMPDDVESGDYLFVIGGNSDLNVIGFTTVSVGGHLRSYGTGGATDWELLCQAPYIFVKLADGSEGGTTVEFETQDTDDFATPTRSCVLISLCYRWPEPPLSNPLGDLNVDRGPDNTCVVDQLRFIGTGDGTPWDSADDSPGGAYPGSTLTADTEVRIIGMIGAAGDSPTNTFPLDSADWYGEAVVDRTGLHGIDGTGGPILGDAGTSVSVADQMGVGSPDGTVTPNAGIVIAGGTDVGGFLHAITLMWPPQPLLAYWGINATTPA